MIFFFVSLSLSFLFSQIKIFYFHKLLSGLTKTKITLVSAETNDKDFKQRLNKKLCCVFNILKAE